MDEPLAQAPAEAPLGAPAAPAAPARRRGVLGGLLALATLVFSKLKFVLVGLQFLKLGKFLTTGLSMIVAVGVYTMVFGLPFAAGFVALIFVHEMGHAAVIRSKGIRASAPIFIPFFGAAIVMKDQPRNAQVEAEVAIGGPLVGGVGAAFCWALGAALSSPLLLALAHTGFFLNLFNLLPISPLDGGRVAGAISRWLWVAGLALAIPLVFLWTSPLLLMVVVLGGLRAWGGRKTAPEGASYFDVPTRVRWTLAALYFGLALLLAFGSIVSEQALRASPGELV